jgi:hypothetical protein
MQVGIQGRHRTLHDGVRQALHSLAACLIVITIENTLAAGVEDTKAGLHKITLVIMLALANAHCGIL